MLNVLTDYIMSFTFSVIVSGSAYPHEEKKNNGGSVGDGAEQIETPIFSGCAAYVLETFPIFWSQIWIVFFEIDTCKDVTILFLP